MKNVIIVTMVVLVGMACSSQKNTTTTTPTTTSNSERQQSPRNGERGQKGERPSIEEIFKMDANNDGKLAITEVTGRLEKDFSKIDTDGDGFITRTEFENAPKPQRGQRPQRN